MKTKHTPGPWNYSKGYGWGFNVSAGKFTQVVKPDERGPIGKEEDARLIAAAPDLLVAVQGLLNLFEQHEKRGHTISPVGDFARAAVAKATGAA